MTEVVRVNLRERGYRIEIEPGALTKTGARMRHALGGKSRSAVLITNPTVHGLYGKPVEKALAKEGFTVHRVLVGDGERFKTLKTAGSIYTFLLQNRIERSDVIVGLGGGVVGDLAGFVAATYSRGLALVQIPTTLLAQIDSSIGGKTGVNHPLGKNMIGAFHQPSLVLIDPQVLQTLPSRELRSGVFVAIKYGIKSDKRLVNWILHAANALQDGQPGELSHLIAACCRIKAGVVERDEKEGSVRRILNFGHTVGHALESMTNYTRFLHGEAVAYGMKAAARIAELISILPSSDRKQVDDAISSFGRLPKTGSLASGDIISAMRRDKKVSSGKLVFVLPVRIGRVVV
ncbi:MAG: 3-dehydroquinate synthase, partial [Blastocatellia bacterium]